MYIKKIKIKNIRCFKKIDIDYDLSTKAPPWTVIIGDNATGKSTFLRCVALGLCDQSSAAGLMKESDEGYIRRKAKKGEIVIDLCDDQNLSGEYRIVTTITKESSGRFIHEKLSQKTTPREFPWEKVFACAYGTCRGASGSGDIAGWSMVNAVYNLFNYTEGLQNPELMLYRIKSKDTVQKIKTVLQGVLPGVKKIHSEITGINIDGIWGDKMPLRDLADGYRSTFLWITDLIGWAIAYEPQVRSCKTIKGLLLIDEIENHLHPKWQKIVIEDLREQFPSLQLITTTHSPLVASGFGTLIQKDTDKRLLLTLNKDNEVSKEELPPMIGWRADQILASKAFDYQITGESDEVDKLLNEASMLAGKKRRTKDENERYRKVKQKIALARLSERQTKAEDEIDRQVAEYLIDQIKQKEESIFGADNDKNIPSKRSPKEFVKKAAKKKRK